MGADRWASWWAWGPALQRPPEREPGEGVQVITPTGDTAPPAMDPKCWSGIFNCKLRSSNSIHTALTGNLPAAPSIPLLLEAPDA